MLKTEINHHYSDKETRTMVKTFFEDAAYGVKNPNSYYDYYLYDSSKIRWGTRKIGTIDVTQGKIEIVVNDMAVFKNIKNLIGQSKEGKKYNFYLKLY